MWKYRDDVLILTGCGFIVYATSLINEIAALYVTGAIFILMGVLIGIGEQR